MAWTNPTITDATQQIDKIEYYKDGILVTDDVQALMYSASASGSASYIWKHPYTISVSSGTPYANISFSATDYYTQSVTATEATGLNSYPKITINGTTTTVSNITPMQTGYLTRRFYWTGTGAVTSDKSVVLMSEDIDRIYTSSSALFYSLYGVNLTTASGTNETYAFSANDVTGNATVTVGANKNNQSIVTLGSFGSINRDTITMSITADNPAFGFPQPVIGGDVSGYTYAKIISYPDSSPSETNYDIVSCPYNTTITIGVQNFSYNNFLIVPTPRMQWTQISNEIKSYTFTGTNKTETFSETSLGSNYDSSKPLLLLIVSNYDKWSQQSYYLNSVCGRIYSSDASTVATQLYSTGYVFSGAFLPVRTGSATVEKTTTGYILTGTRNNTTNIKTFYVVGAFQPAS